MEWTAAGMLARDSRKEKCTTANSRQAQGRNLEKTQPYSLTVSAKDAG